ncbi:MAG: WbqC family protein [Cyanobacteriota bacterium]
MKIAIMQPYLFPYIGYFQLINSVDKFIFFDDVNFIKKGWINRNNLLLNNDSFLFTIPLIKPSQNKLINETYILDENAWKINLLKTIKTSYQKAPFFEIIFPVLENTFNSKMGKISDLAILSILTVCKYLNIEKKFDSSSKYNNKELKAQERIIDLCLINKATEYINPIGGINLYNKNDFKKNEIELYFIKTKEIKYIQFNKNFIPNLSIIDLLMFVEKSEIRKLLDENELL